MIAPKIETVQEDLFPAWDEIAARLLDGQSLRLTWDDAHDAYDLHVRRIRVFDAMKRRGVKITTKIRDGAVYVAMKERIPLKDDAIVVTHFGGDAA